jgi:ATP phosphoribosyltransferase
MKTNPNLTIAIPSNGALYEPTLVFLSECGLKVNRENNRRYIATIPFLPGVDVLFQRSSDITGKVEDGNADLGIVGYDRYLELKTNNKPTMVLMNQLGFGACSLAIGIPDSWVDVTSIADLAEVAAEFRSNGMTIRVATKFPRLTEQFFMANSISNFSIVPSSGTLEIAPEMGFADIISDITSSGTTMKENRLKTLSGGTIIKSECCLISNNISISTDSFKSEAAEQIIAMIKANIQSKNFYQVKSNIKS